MRSTVPNNQMHSSQANGGIREDIWRKYKKSLKKDQTLEYVKLHRYFMSKKERRLAKEKLNKAKGK